MAVRNYVSAAILTSVNSNTFNAAYHPINTGGLPAPCFLIRIINESDEDVLVSYDGGITASDFVPHGTTLQLPVQSNAQPNNFIANFKKGTVVSVNGAAAGTGLVYLAAYYQGDID